MTDDRAKILEIDIAKMTRERGNDNFFIDMDVASREYDNADGLIIRNGVVIILCKAEGGTITVDGKRYKLDRNNVVLLPENHIINNLGQGLMQQQCMVAVSIDYILNMPSPIDTNIFSYSRYISVISVSDTKFDDLMGYYRFIYKESNEQSRYQSEIIQSIFYALILEIVGEYERIFENQEQQHIKSDNLSDSFFRLLAQHYKEHHSVKYYAERMHLTPKYLSTAIKRATGRSILDWIHEAILIDAKMLLRTTDLTVQEIAEQLHFSSPSAFVQFIKAHTGKTPRELK